jgi:AFG3 family protein
MLEPGDVEKIVVTNRNTARVFLRPGARGVPARVPQGGGGPFGGRLGSSSGQNRTNVSEPWGGMDSTIMNMDSNDQMSMGTDSSPSGSGVASPLGGLDQHNQHNQLVYHFSLGSVENFERKLEDAQRELGMSTRDFVPVQYATETSWGTELFKLAPTMVIMGMIFFAMRNMGGAGGGGGGGGMGNIFKIGKSPAKKIKKEDINVNFSDVAGCDEAKREIMEFVDFLKDSERFTKLGAKIPKGALLCGPPVRCTFLPFSCILFLHPFYIQFGLYFSEHIYFLFLNSHRALVRHCWRRLLLEKPVFLSFPSVDQTLLKCLSV